jgi:hypothetical protein
MRMTAAALLHTRMSHLGCLTRRCSAEQGWSSFVAAHLAKVERRAGQRSLQLPARFAHAQARRAKLTDISGGETKVMTWDVEPAELLEEAFDAIERATFVGKGDRAFVQYRLAEFEWIIRSAMLLATEQSHGDGEASVEPTTRSFVRLMGAGLNLLPFRRNARSVEGGNADSRWRRHGTAPLVSMAPLHQPPLIGKGSGARSIASLSQQELAIHEGQEIADAQLPAVLMGLDDPRRRNQRRRSSGGLSVGSHVGRRDSVSSRASRRYEALEDDVEAQQEGL